MPVRKPPTETRSDVWQRRDGRFDVQITVPQYGRRHRFGTTAATRAGAEEALKELWRRWYAGELRPVDPANPSTLRALFEDWMDGHSARNILEAAVVRTRVRPTAERYLLAGLGALPVQRLTAARIRRHYAGFRRPAGVAPGKWTETGIAWPDIHGWLVRVLDMAVRRGLIRSNPAREVGAPDVGMAVPTDPDALSRPWLGQSLSPAPEAAASGASGGERGPGDGR